MKDGPVVAILLAAGESTRMGRLKQLLPWGGATLLEWQVGQLREASASEVIVVLGHEASSIQGRVEKAPTRFVVNEGYREGRASSLRCGAAAVENEAGAVLILGVDQPRPGWLAKWLIDAWRESGAKIVQPRLAGRRDHPVLVDGSLLVELRMVRDEDLGLRAVLTRHADESRVVEVETKGLAVDLNTLADYESALAAYERGEWQ